MNLTVDKDAKQATTEATAQNDKDCGCGYSGDCQKSNTRKWVIGVGLGLLVVGLIIYRIRKAR